MARIVVLGAALGGLQTALLVAQDGHEVTVLERDPRPPPLDAKPAWSRWPRPGIAQLRQTHLPLARWLQLAEAHLPDLVREMTEAGAVRMNVLAPEPAFRGPLMAGDERFDTLAARRSLLEAAATRTAENAGIRIGRGTVCRGLRSSPGPRTPYGGASGDRVPHVTGVETDAGGSKADLVVDCTGRRSQLPSWLRDIGVPCPVDESGRRGFTYYSQYFRSADGAIPTDRFPLVVEHGSLGLLRIPADHGTYSLCLISRSDDEQLRRALRNERAWSAAVRLFPGADRWLDGRPVTDGIQIMAGLTDRKRLLYDTQHPLVTGLMAVGDAWAITTPTVGRGLAMSLQHSLLLRDILRRTGTAHPVELVTGFAEATRNSLGRIYEQTTAYTRHRLSEMDAHTAGTPYRNPDWNRAKALALLAQRDTDALRAERAAAHLLPGAREVLAAPALANAVTRLVPEVERRMPPGPSRADLLKAIEA
ncbi:FAD-binding oxidoreductase [Streptomyces sp. IB201691-2A2]|uniref:FAD-binding oxidoreductase n=1 Tax=Streptomyces sp. IB201691-2A2 TaxID=2561920 RepID=UPI00117FAB20|nr:FAD-binding oxidoreductase [Streptomyces sp. IB201691-2A2]TRO59123.1 FAD-binding oxidoreductase [Streptomyces sp. IB201691-2A2]